MTIEIIFEKKDLKKLIEIEDNSSNNDNKKTEEKTQDFIATLR